MSKSTYHMKENLGLQRLPANVSAWPTRATRSLNELLVVEHRDEIFARLEADLTTWGIQVYRAMNAEEATRLYHHRPTELVLSHADLPDETGWLFACKLRIAWPSAKIWVYTPRWTAKESVLADFTGCEEVIAYGGDLYRLAAEMFERLVVIWYANPSRKPEAASSLS